MSSSYGTNPHDNEGFEPYEFGGFGAQPDSSKGTGPGFPGDLGASVFIPVNGNMNSGSAGSPQLSTLDEPVSATLLRDLRSIGVKLRQVLLPRNNNKSILKDWDLWGPLLLCLALSIRLSLTANPDQGPQVFTAIFVIVWCGAAVITFNSKLLGGTLSFFQSVCVLGYCIFPLVLVSIVTLFIGPPVIRAILALVSYAWSVYASIGFFSDVSLENRRTLAIYPLCLFYFVLAWMVMISKSILG
ncbi:hypothetical protein DFS34DRAFT_345765 [Phlyctochytrium arcticum]|nr:hypothetical protein DFS34DRAFT_345765 [Phlyctochytrium arcticum]